jgi:MFS family permease
MTLRDNAFGALRSRQYRRWFLSQILSSSGAMTQAVGQGWLIVQMHGGGLALGVASGATFLPTLLFGAPFGALADRHDRRTILIVTQSLQAAIAGLAAGLTATGAMTIWLLVVLAFAMGTAFAADAPARQVYVMDLVGGTHVAGAISLNEVVINSSRAIGPALGGIVLALSSVWVCFLVNALTFLPALAVLVLQRRPAVSAVPRQAAGRAVRAGVHIAITTPAILACLLMAVTAGAIYNVGVIGPLLATRVFHVGGGEYGAMLAAFGLGAVPGALCAAASGPQPTGPEVRRLGLIAGAAVVACAFAPVFPLVLVGFAVVGAVSIWFIARANAFVLLSVEPAMRGRIMGIWSLALPGMNPVTGLLVGVSADTWGPQTAYAGVGMAAVLTAAGGWHALRRQRFAEETIRAAGQLVPDAREASAVSQWHEHAICAGSIDSTCGTSPARSSDRDGT